MIYRQQIVKNTGCSKTRSASILIAATEATLTNQVCTMNLYKIHKSQTGLIYIISRSPEHTQNKM